MAYWDPDLMLEQKREIDAVLLSMEKNNDELLADLGVYSAIVKDAVSVNTKKMIEKIDSLLQEIREQVEKQAKKMEEGAKGLLGIEANASDVIKKMK